MINITRLKAGTSRSADLLLAVKLFWDQRHKLELESNRSRSSGLESQSRLIGRHAENRSLQHQPVLDVATSC